MIAFLILFLHVLVSPFKARAQLEAEIVVLRHQLNVLHRRVPSKPKLAIVDRLLFVWLHRLFSVGVERHHHCQARDGHPVASDRFPAVLALEVARSWWSSKGSN
jgi:hypothetical protein